MKKFKILSTALTLIAIINLISCASTVTSFEGNDADFRAAQTFESNLYVPQNITWENLTPNGEISYFNFQNEDMPVIYHCVKVDLSSGNIALTYSPDESVKPAAKYSKIPTKTFAKNSNSIVAINFTQFDTSIFSPNYKFVGIHRINKVNYSEPNERYSALCLNKISEENSFRYEAAIIQNQTAESIENWDYAFGGFFQVLKDGEPQSFKVHSYDSRTGVGISKDGSTLYILVAEGNNKRQSIGISYQQSAEIFKALGAWNAMQADGGNSSDLCIKGKSVLSPTFTVSQGNSIGFRTLSK